MVNWVKIELLLHHEKRLFTSSAMLTDLGSLAISFVILLSIN